MADILHITAFFYSDVKYNYTKLEHVVVMNILNVDTRQRQIYHMKAKLCYVMRIVLKVYPIKKWTKLYRRAMQWWYVLHRLCLYDKVIFYRTLSLAIKQNVNMLRHLFGEISHFEFDAYHVILTGASDLKISGWCILETDKPTRGYFSFKNKFKEDFHIWCRVSIKSVLVE